MSGEIREMPNPHAQDIRAKAAEWLERRENSSQGEDEALNAWLAESPAHEIAYWRLEAAWKHADRLSALRRPGLREFLDTKRRRISVAAILGLAVVSAGTAAFLLSDKHEQSFSTPIGDHESITLVDGSQIELNTDTALRVDDSMHQRLVWLDRGEAYFQIKHNPARPFVVRIGNHRVTDIGTAFTIRRDADQIEVSLLEGRARLETASIWSKSKSAILYSGDLAVAGTHGLSVMKKSLQILAHDLAWRSGKLVFDHVTLADAAAQLNRYNHRQVVIADPTVALLAIDGTFPVNGVGEFAHAAKEVFGLRVEQLGDETVISR